MNTKEPVRRDFLKGMGATVTAGMLGKSVLGAPVISIMKNQVTGEC